MANLISRDNAPLTIFDLISRPLSSFDDDFAPLESFAGNFKTDIKDEGSCYSLRADLPGVKKEDIKLDFADGQLTVSAEHHSVRDEQGDDGYILKERVAGTYSRSFSFDDVDQDGIEATFDNGVLKVTLPKQQNVQNAARIEIK